MARSIKEVHTINYYPINEGAARRAKEMNSFSDYKEGSATAEYRAMVDKAAAVAEKQKSRVDPMYHEKIDHAYKNKCGFITGNVLDGSVLIVNTDLIGDIKIEGYEDLLNPALKGKIATADPSNSSSAFAHLTNMLLAMGGYEDDKAWQYVHDLFENVDGKICESSSGVYKGVADGEYVVGLSYEDPCAQLVLDGAPVKIVYMKEGTVFLPASATIIKGAKNMDNAKLFIDFILSEEVQNIWGSTLTNRPVMKDAATNDAMTPMADINVIEEDIPYVSAHKSELVDKYTEIFTDLQSK